MFLSDKIFKIAIDCTFCYRVDFVKTNVFETKNEKFSGRRTHRLVCPFTRNCFKRNFIFLLVCNVICTDTSLLHNSVAFNL